MLTEPRTRRPGGRRGIGVYAAVSILIAGLCALSLLWLAPQWSAPQTSTVIIPGGPPAVLGAPGHWQYVAPGAGTKQGRYVWVPSAAQPGAAGAPPQQGQANGAPAAGAAPAQPGVPGAPPGGISRSPGAALKPEIGGTLDRNGVPQNADAPALGGFVINAKWSDLQPQPYGPIARPNVIDQGIAAVRKINASRAGSPMAVKLRIFAGIDAPQWLKDMDGGPIAVHAGVDPQSGTIGHFWTVDFGNAYADLMAKLAALYDGTPELEEVTVSRCTTVFAEPFIRDISDPQTVHNLLAAGFTAAADATCETAQLDEASVWQTTPLSLSFNPYQHINSDGSTSIDEAFTESVMAYCRSLLGAQCVLENNSIRAQQLGGYGPMYHAIQGMGRPITFQTATPQQVGNLGQTLQWAIGVGAGAVELPAGYDHMLTPGQLQQYTAELESNARSG